MLHYRLAQQLDTGTNSMLIQENIGKLRRQQLMMTTQRAPVDTASTITVETHLCQTRMFASNSAAAIGYHNTLEPTDTFLQHSGGAQLFSVTILSSL